jgi:solute carrier family 45, member 1/2/4
MMMMNLLTSVPVFQSGAALNAPEVPHGGQKLTLSHYLKSIVVMPSSLRVVCLTNLFCWMAHVCYSLYFTDFVGEAVFGGNPAVSIPLKC